MVENDIRALVERLDALADPMQEAMPRFENTDWRALAASCARAIRAVKWRPRLWAKCPDHGQERESSWGCPDCLAELREENAQLRQTAPTSWYFNELQPSGTLYAKAPSGAEFVVKRGDMNSIAGRELLQAMAAALTGPQTTPTGNHPRPPLELPA